jgi:hypothetical protein
MLFIVWFLRKPHFYFEKLLFWYEGKKVSFNVFGSLSTVTILLIGLVRIQYAHILLLPCHMSNCDILVASQG